MAGNVCGVQQVHVPGISQARFRPAAKSGRLQGRGIVGGRMAQLFSAWWSNADGGKTFRPRYSHKPGSRQLRLHHTAERTLGSGNLRMAVALPEGEDLNEWLAVKTVDLFNEVALVYGMVSEFCTEHSCPKMCAGSRFEYKWGDGVTYKTPTEVSAPKYVELLMAWVKKQLDDPTRFPVEPGAPFPPNFREMVSNICRRLFRVYGHVFYSHRERVIELTFDAHLHSCFKHFMYFILEYSLVRAEELQPLQPLIDKLLAEDDAKWGPRSAPKQAGAPSAA